MKDKLSSADMTASRSRHREASIWQRRFWEHQNRDEEDFRRHMDYIHINPVKHGLVTSASDWPYSSLPRHVAQGIYPENWGSDALLAIDGKFGE